MPKWLAITHVVVEAETKEAANTLVTAKLAEHLPTPVGEQREAAQTLRYTVINVEQLPDYTAPSSQRHG